MADKDPRIDAFFNEAKNWPEELKLLRAMLLDAGLTETFKWRGPCYTYDDGNVALVWDFKDSAALGFFKGVLLTDPEGVLVAPGENSRAVRMFRFTGLDQIEALRRVIEAMIREAIKLEKAGAKVDLPKNDIAYPDELIAAMENDPELADAFEALTPGRKRGYAIHFAQPKQSATRVSRIEKSRDRILEGKGMHDR